MCSKSKDIVVTGFSNANNQGVILHLNKPTSLKTGKIVASEFWVSWDKIGNSLFDNYTEFKDPVDIDKLRKESELDSWEVGDKFTTPETGDTVFTVTRHNKYDVEAIDYRSRAGFTIFSKSYITKVK